jgi:hypothetical protein
MNKKYQFFRWRYKGKVIIQQTPHLFGNCGLWPGYFPGEALDWEWATSCSGKQPVLSVWLSAPSPKKCRAEAWVPCDQLQVTGPDHSGSSVSTALWPRKWSLQSLPSCIPCPDCPFHYGNCSLESLNEFWEEFWLPGPACSKRVLFVEFVNSWLCQVHASIILLRDIWDSILKNMVIKKCIRFGYSLKEF